MKTTAYPDAELRRDTGIEDAVEHADRVLRGWSEEAVSFVYLYAIDHAGEDFLAEDARDWAHRSGLPHPPDERAWGAVMRRAQSAGYISNVGYRAARSSNLSPKILWRGAE